MSEPDPLRTPGESPWSKLSNEPRVPPGPVGPPADFVPSPYQSPAILPNEEPVAMWRNDSVPPMPIAASVLFGIVASGLTVATAFASTGMINNYFPFAIFLGPPLLIGLFVLTAITFYSSHPLVISKSTGWKILMVLLVPPVSMLVFVPTCIGSTIFMMPVVSRTGSSEWLMLLPVFIAYFACAVVISRRLRWRFIRRLDPHESIT
jgi:hypothetical protein